MQRRARHRTHELPNRHKNHGSLLVRIIKGHLIRLSILQDPRPYVLIFDHLSIGQLMEALVLHQCATVELPTINKLSTPSQLARPAFGEMDESALLRGRAAYFLRLCLC